MIYFFTTLFLFKSLKLYIYLYIILKFKRLWFDRHLPPKKQRLLNLPEQKTLFNFSFSNSKDDNNNPVDTNTNTAIDNPDKSTDHGDDINPGIVPESETENESQYVRIEQ